MTTYNGQHFIVEQLESLIEQQGVSLHIYAFDDGSQDETVAILNQFSQAHPGVFSIFSNEVNSGGTGLNIFNNLGFISQTHDFIALADQDDIWLPQKLKRAVDAMLLEKSDLYFSNLSSWDGAEKTLGVVKKDAPLRAYDHLFGGGSAGCTYVMSAAFFDHLKDRVGRVDLSGVKRISHDWIIYFLARQGDFGVTASSDAFIKYRIHINSQYGAMSLGGLAAVLRKLRMLRGGFLSEQVENALLFADPNSEERKILLLFKRGWWGRLKMLAKYRVSLVRKNSRFGHLVFASLCFFE